MIHAHRGPSCWPQVYDHEACTQPSHVLQRTATPLSHLFHATTPQPMLHLQLMLVYVTRCRFLPYARGAEAAAGAAQAQPHPPLQRLRRNAVRAA